MNGEGATYMKGKSSKMSLMAETKSTDSCPDFLLYLNRLPLSNGL